MHRVLSPENLFLHVHSSLSTSPLFNDRSALSMQILISPWHLKVLSLKKTIALLCESYGGIHFPLHENRADDRWLRFNGSFNASYGGAAQEYLPTEPGDNGTKLEGGWAGGIERSNLRECNKSWPLRDFIVQKCSLLLCAVTESGAAPLGVNSQSTATSETCYTAQLANQVTPLVVYDEHIICKPDAVWIFFSRKKRFWNKTKQYILQMSNILSRHPVVTTVKNWCWPLEDDEGRRIVCRPNGRLSQRWFITGTVTECSWQRGHGSPPHRQTGHCYLAGRSELSLLISTVTPDESTTHQRISAQPGEKACARLSFHTVSWFQSWCQSEEGFL